MANDLMEWKPFREVSRLRREMDRLREDFFGPGRRIFRETQWVPAVDVAETPEKVEIRAEVPGIEAKDIDISITGDVLTVRGERRFEREVKEESLHRLERVYGKFERSIPLPVPVQGDKVKATYRDGVLEVRLPKVEAVKPKQIKIEVL